MRLYLFFVLVLAGLFFGKAQENSTNIILMIGDGMGLTQITAGMYFNGNKTSLEGFTSIGLSKTHSSNSLVTDSAASGTAMAIGVKTLNGLLGSATKTKHQNRFSKSVKNKVIRLH